MSPIPEKLFLRSETLRRSGRVFPGIAESGKRDVTWRIILKLGLVLISFGATGNILCQNPDSKETASGPKLDLAGKRTFEARCATCHGLDGLGGEHAPDIIRPHDAKALSDEAMLSVIHDGIPEAGMPAFPSIAGEDGRALVEYLRFLQGRSDRNSVPGDPARGRDLFFGTGGCSACHQIGRRGQFAAGDLAGFARDHSEQEIRDAILKPPEEMRESATAVARNGRKFSGMIRNEDNASLQLQDGDGRFYLLMKSSLVSVNRKTEDPMPLDYGQRLNSSELGDLVAYIVREAQLSEPSSSSSKEGHAQD
jgi:cytochrome c oxidase cbb3-type subunit III